MRSSPARPAARIARRMVLVAATALALAGCDLLGLAPTMPPPATPAPPTGTSAPPPSGAPAWQPGPDAPLALTEVAAAAHGGRIWVAGGLDGSGRGVTAVLSLDPATGTWADGPPLPGAVHHSALASDGDALWLIGGYEGDGFDRPTDRVLQLQGERWVEAAALPEPRAAGAAAWDGAGRLIYVGGVGRAGPSGSVFAQADHGWEARGTLPEAREHTAATSDGTGRVIVLGGRRGGLDRNLATVELIEPDGGIRRLGELPTARGGVAAFWWPALGACLVGGESPDGTNPEAECIDLDGRVTVLPPLARPRHGLGAAVVGGTAYVLLGGEQPGLFVSGLVESLALP
ncbi:MAG TPA: kelch repeat-containing protein [Candidatus Limnocylindrales bacterium]|nr:kelch repeat-containing protein [Candidatus Limnocylindrales bacterium]